MKVLSKISGVQNNECQKLFALLKSKIDILRLPACTVSSKSAFVLTFQALFEG